MPVDNRRRELLVLLTVILIVIFYCDYMELCDEAKYSRQPPLNALCTIDRFNYAPTQFEALVTFKLDVFYDRVLHPLEHLLTWPLNWMDNVDAGAMIYPHRKKQRQLSPANRLLRYLLWWKQTPIPLLQQLFGQCDDSVRRDIDFISGMIVKGLSSVYLCLAQPDSVPYDEQIGIGQWSQIFTNNVYLMDVTNFPIRRPVHAQRHWYCGHHRLHCEKYMMTHNQETGEVVHISQGFPGSNNDLHIYSHSLLGTNPTRFVRRPHTIITDSIFSSQGWPLLTRYSHRNNLSHDQLLYNRLLSQKRIIVENFYGRIKQTFPKIMEYSFDLDKMDVHITAAVIMQNILLRHQAPLRAQSD